MVVAVKRIIQALMKHSVIMKDKHVLIPFFTIPKSYLMVLACPLSSNSTLQSNHTFVEVESRSY